MQTQKKLVTLHPRKPNLAPLRTAEQTLIDMVLYILMGIIVLIQKLITMGMIHISD